MDKNQKFFFNRAPKIILNIILVIMAFFVVEWHPLEILVNAGNSVREKMLNETRVLGEETERESDYARYQSENFRVREISFGGPFGTNELNLEGEGEINIEDIRTEIYTSKDKDKEDINLIISCRTNKLVRLEVRYNKKKRNGRAYCERGPIWFDACDSFTEFGC